MPALPSSRSRRRRRQELSVALTNRGWGIVLLALVLASVGRWTGESGLVHISLFAGVVLLLAWPLARWNLARLRCERQVPEAVFVGAHFVAEVHLINEKRSTDSFNIEATDEILGPFGKGMSLRRLRAGQSAGESFEARLRQRGVSPTFRWQITSTFPCGLWRVTRNGTTHAPMTVYPRPVVPAGLDDPRAEDLMAGEENWQPQPDWSGEYLGIRDFRSGDPLKMIHWRATARAQRLVVREFDRRLPAKYALFFHSYQPPGQPRMPDAFESALEMLAGLLLRCRGSGVPLELIADFHGWQPFVLTDSQDLARPLTAIAAAKWSPSPDLTVLISAIEKLVPESRAYVVSDTPVRLWQHLLPPGRCELTCLSVGDMRRRQPGLNFLRPS
ncbi:MAG: DUF58 domain-containing protein [Verrucomicrobiales bacterium]